MVIVTFIQFHGDQVIPRFASLNDSAWVGCDDLLERMAEVQDIKYHIFGHIHEGYGVTKNKKIKDVTFINASSVDVNYRCVNKPIMFYIKGRGRQYCDVKSLQDIEDGDNDNEEKKNDGQKEKKEEEDNQYKINENYENMNDPNNQIEDAVNMNLIDKGNGDKDEVDATDEMEPTEIPHHIDDGSSNNREYSSNDPTLEDVADDEL